MLPIKTIFQAEKVTQATRTDSLWPGPGHLLEGYEIHHGRTSLCTRHGEPLAQGGVMAGWRSGRAVGSYLHGLLTCDAWRSDFLNQVRGTRGFPPQATQTSTTVEYRIRRWAEHVQQHLRPGAFQRICNALR
jgi:adenosylcobyric acid synthase